jgi:predicted transcriptional regulator
MQTSVLLSIKPQFAQRIFDGSKQFEFRKKVFSNRSVKKIIVYVTAPIKQVIGEFEIEEIIELEPEQLWEHTKEYSGIQKDYFDAYFDGREIGYAIRIGKTQVYDKPLELQSSFNVKHPPQSFIYLHQ